MNTEDDTFLALSRPSVAEMLRYYDEWVGSKIGALVDTESLDELCARHKWTWEEFSPLGALLREKQLNDRG